MAMSVWLTSSVIYVYHVFSKRSSLKYPQEINGSCNCSNLEARDFQAHFPGLIGILIIIKEIGNVIFVLHNGKKDKFFSRTEK